MNEDVMIFLIDLQRRGFSYYVFWRAKQGQHVLHVVGKKYDHSLSGPCLESLTEMHRDMINNKPKKVEKNIDSFM